MEKKFVDVQLDVEVNGTILLAHLVFTNNTSNKVYLDKKTICISGKTRRNIFDITDEQNKKVNYLGMMEKRIVIPEDFMLLDSGETVKTNISLNDVYDVSKGNKYFVQLSAYHPSYDDEGPLNKLESNKVEVVY